MIWYNLSDAERAALLGECQKADDPRLYPFVLLAVSTGARAAELTGLTWGDVDTVRGVATLRDTKNGDMRALPIKGAALTAIKAMQPDDAAPTLMSSSGAYVAATHDDKITSPQESTQLR